MKADWRKKNKMIQVVLDCEEEEEEKTLESDTSMKAKFSKWFQKLKGN